MSSISGYNSQYRSVNNKKVYTTESGHKYWLTTEDNSGLNISDFFSLIAAQLSNQDFMNPTDNTEFLAQLAQFTALQMQENILYAANASFASSLIGKTVIAAKLDSTGKVVQTTGVVERIAFSSGGYEFYVNGQAFSLENLMEIKAAQSSSETNGENNNSGDSDTNPPSGGEEVEEVDS